MRRRSCSGSRISSTACCAGWRTIMKRGTNRKEYRNKNARGKSRHRFGLCRMNRPLCCLLASHAPCIAPHFNDLRSIQPVKQASFRSFCRASRVSQATVLVPACVLAEKGQEMACFYVDKAQNLSLIAKSDTPDYVVTHLLRAGYQKSRFTFSAIRHAGPSQKMEGDKIKHGDCFPRAARS